jgi:hypothetical protein
VIILIAALAVGAGLALAVISLLQRAKEHDDELAAILQLPFGERDIPIEAVTESRAGWNTSTSWPASPASSSGPDCRCDRENSCWPPSAVGRRWVR